MYKLFLMTDEWDNDVNFVRYELAEMMKHYEVTVICNSASAKEDVNGRFIIYQKPGIVSKLKSVVRALCDRDFWSEIKKAVSGKSVTFARFPEIMRFYVNADLFLAFMRKQGLLSDGVIYYSFWYFWKCYAISRVIDIYKGSRLITRAHGYDLYDEVRPSGYQPFKEFMDERLNRIVFISEYGRDYYFKRYGKKDNGKYILSCLGSRGPAESAPYERTDTVTLVSCSHIIPVKRIHLIVKALALIDEINIKWTHFGTGNKTEEIMKLARDLLGEKSNISYKFTGQVDNRVIHEFYGSNNVDSFISVSSSEGNPVSVMEAMSCGIPVIAPDICNFPNMIGDGGILIPGECSPEDVAAAIRRLVSMPDDEIMSMRRVSRKMWEEKFDAENNSRAFVKEVLENI